MIRILGLVAVLLVVACLCGCPKPADTTAPPVTAEPAPPVAPAVEAPAEPPPAAASAEGVVADNKVGIEYYPGAKVEMQQSDASTNSEMAALSTTDAQDKVVKFYKDKYAEKAAKKAGTATSVEGADVITWSEGGRMYSATIIKKDENTTGIMLFSKKE